MSRLTDLLNQLKQNDPRLATDLEKEFKALSSRRSFGLNFERHRPENVELYQRPIRKGDKVRVLPPRGDVRKGDQRLWLVTAIKRRQENRIASIELLRAKSAETKEVDVNDLVVTAEFRDYIYPGLISTGKVGTQDNKPFHSVINGENYHALNALTYTHRGKVDAIYIDPPYNTGAKDWRYNNDYVEAEDLYRHSKWLAFIERRLKVARTLLKPSGSMIITIDEHEVHRLGVLLDQILPDFHKQTVTIVNNPKGVTQGYLSRVEEYAIFCFGPQSKIYTNDDDLLSRQSPKSDESEVKRPRWKGLLRSGDEASRRDREKMFYPVWIDTKHKKLIRAGEFLPLTEEPNFNLRDKNGHIAVWPVRKDGSLGRWSVGSDTFNSLIADGLARLGRYDDKRNTWGVSYLSQQLREDINQGILKISQVDSITGVADVIYADKLSRKVRTVWHRTSHDAGAHGTELISSLLGPNRKFPFPKSLYAVEDSLRILTKGNKEAVILDFFSGSGTTAHAVMRLNRQDGGTRQSISITNNEVGADEQLTLKKKGLRAGDEEWEKWGICEYITKPRIKAAITGQTPNGDPIEGEYKFNDEFPMSDGFNENAEFFTLTYESGDLVEHNMSFERVAPLLWLRAGSQGRRIETITEKGWEVTNTYGVLERLDQANKFCEEILKTKSIRIVYVVTDDERRFQSIVKHLPTNVEPVRLYESYLTNFQFSNGE